MTPSQLNDLIEARHLTRREAAKLLGVHLRTLMRWLADETPIDSRNALYIRSILKAK